MGCVGTEHNASFVTFGMYLGIIYFLTTRNKQLLGALGLTTRSKDATRGSWHRY